MSYTDGLFNSYQLVLVQSIEDAIRIIDTNVRQIETIKNNKYYENQKIVLIYDTNRLVQNAYNQLYELDKTPPSNRVRVERQYLSKRLRDAVIKFKNQNESNLSELKDDLRKINESRGVSDVDTSMMVTQRQKELLELESQMRDLKEIMVDLGKLVNEQDETINSIQDNVVRTEINTVEVKPDLSEIIRLKRDIRKKKIILIASFIFIVLLIAAVIVLAIRPWK